MQARHRRREKLVDIVIPPKRVCSHWRPDVAAQTPIEEDRHGRITLMTRTIANAYQCSDLMIR